jgi:hypothetical protein
MAGASLPNRALSASATCPAGTIGIGTAGATEFGMGNGNCDGDASEPPEPNASLRLPCPGAISPVDGVAENNEFWSGVCADAVVETASATTSAMTFRFPNVRPMTRSFSA